MLKYPHAKDGTKYSVFVLGLFLTYELLARKAFSIFIEKKTQPPEIIRYVNAFIETSLPSVGLLIFARFQSPTDAILSPIILHQLRLLNIYPFLFIFIIQIKF